MKAILIDPRELDVSEIDIPLENGDYHEITKAIDCELFAVAGYLNKKGDCLMVDDEGLLNNPEHFFLWRGNPIAGKAIVLGTDACGDTVAPTVTADEVANQIAWLTNEEAVAINNDNLAAAEADALINNAIGRDFRIFVAGPVLEIHDGKVQEK